jgi:transposase
MRIQLTGPSVKTLEVLLQKMVKFKEVKKVRRISALLEHLHHQHPISQVACKWGVSEAAIYHWVKQFMCKGLASLDYHYKGGRAPKLSLRQQKILTQLLDSGPQGCGFEEGCWNSALVQELIKLKFAVEYHVQYVSALLHKLGYSFQKAERISDYLDPQRRQQWREEIWPSLLAEARRVKGLILFGDEASFAQWGSLGYTWARVGQTPQVKTSGKRKGYKVFGAVEYFSGQVFYQGTSGKFNSESYQAFLEEILEKTTEPIFLVQDGARYHTSKEMLQFFEEHKERLRVYQLPAYSPDYNPIEYLWRKTKRKGTHNKYFAEFGKLAEAVDQALAGFKQQPQEILGLFGCYRQDQAETQQFAA